MAASVGTVVGDYEIVAELGAGGMAELLLGRRLRDGRCFAIKFPKGDDEAMERMFLDEARVAAHIRHPNVVQVEELVEHEGQNFLVMEYLAGLSLSAFLRELVKRERRLTVVSAVAIGCEIAAGLHAAHETRDSSGQPMNVVHRDVSPQNVLLCASGDVKLIDFGIAKARDRLVKTRANEVKGKLRYMAPEQMRRQPLDRRTDVFALGIVLWEMLAMRRLFHRLGDPEVVRRIMAGEFPPPAKWANVPHDLDQLILQCLHPDPDKRPATADELRQGLLRAVPGAASLDGEERSGLLWATGATALSHLVASLPVEAADLGIRRPTRSPEEVLARRTERMEQDAAVLALAEGEATQAGMAAPMLEVKEEGAPAGRVFGKPKSVPPAAPVVPKSALASEPPPAEEVDASPPGSARPRPSMRPPPPGAEPPQEVAPPVVDDDDDYTPVRSQILGRRGWMVLGIGILLAFAFAAWAAAGYPS